MERYVIRGGQWGYERLEVLARSLWPATAALLDRVGLGSGMNCLDLGCGGGAVTLELARLTGQDGQVTGIDMDEVKLELARAAARDRGWSNVKFRAGNAYEWSEPDAYDLVYCRNFLQHLSRPVDVLRAMWAAVKAGGVIVVEDADFTGSFCDPPNAGFDFWVEAYQRVLEHNGGDPQVARKLHRHFRAAGIPAPELTVFQRADAADEAKTLPQSTIEATAEAIVEAGIASADQIAAALADLSAFAADPDTVVSSPRHVQAWSRRALPSPT
jgi:ubiquinone/menaquinone biosynthesis C-methylase UbiE